MAFKNGKADWFGFGSFQLHEECLFIFWVQSPLRYIRACVCEYEWVCVVSIQIELRRFSDEIWKLFVWWYLHTFDSIILCDSFIMHSIRLESPPLSSSISNIDIIIVVACIGLMCACVIFFFPNSSLTRKRVHLFKHMPTNSFFKTF